MNAFWVIISLDCFVVTEVFLFRGVMEQLESGVAESKGVFIPPKILDYDLAFFQSDVRLAFTCRCVFIDVIICFDTDRWRY